MHGERSAVRVDMLKEPTQELFNAVWKDDVSRARAALDAGADLNRRWGDDRPLTAATAMGNAGLVKLLVQRGANVNLMTVTCKTALMIAAGAGRTGIARMLLKAGADVNRLNRFHESALNYAVVWQRLTTVKLLLAAGADIEERQCDWSPLMYAANSGHHQVLKLLLEHGADPGRRDRCGRTPRDIAAAHGYLANVRVFDSFAAKDAVCAVEKRKPGAKVSNRRTVNGWSKKSTKP